MKCLSIRQPWAHLIISGRRKLEIRKWPTSYRGKLLIHASLKVEHKECERLLINPSDIGVILGIVELIDVRVLSKKDWETLRLIHLEAGPRCYDEQTFGWFIENQERFPNPIKYKGALGLFDVPDELLPNHKFKILKNGKIVDSFIPGRFAGWRPRKIFGRLDCKSGMRMKKENRVFFHSWDEAVAEGYHPCKLCKPKPNDSYAP